MPRATDATTIRAAAAACSSSRRTNRFPAKTEVSDVLSKDLGKRGFKFVGSTICYAFMQAVGMADDHLTDCFRKKA